MMPELTNEAEALAQALQRSLGLDLNVLRAWIAHESAWGRSPIRSFNYLNAKKVEGGQLVWASFSSVAEAADYYTGLIHRRPEWYGPIVASAGSSPAQQIAAIAASPWDQSHYGGPGGPNLRRTYGTVARSYGGADFGAVPTNGATPAAIGATPVVFGIGDFWEGFKKAVPRWITATVFFTVGVAATVLGIRQIFRPDSPEASTSLSEKVLAEDTPVGAAKKLAEEVAG